MSKLIKEKINPKTMTISSAALVRIINERKEQGAFDIDHDGLLEAAKNRLTADVFDIFTKVKKGEYIFNGSFLYLELPMIQARILTRYYNSDLALDLQEAFNEVEQEQKQKQKETVDDETVDAGSLLVVLSAYIKGVNKRIEEQERVIIHAKQAIESDKLELSNLTNQLKSIIE